MLAARFALDGFSLEADGRLILTSAPDGA